MSVKPQYLNQDEDGELESKRDSCCHCTSCEGPWVLRAEAGATLSFHRLFQRARWVHFVTYRARDDPLFRYPSWNVWPVDGGDARGDKIACCRDVLMVDINIDCQYRWSISIVGMDDQCRLSKCRSLVYRPSRVFLAYIGNRYRHSVQLYIDDQYRQSISMIHTEDQILSIASVAMINFCTPLR